MTIVYPYKNLVFRDRNSKSVLKKVLDFAAARTAILLIGGNGTGKKELAQIYHYSVFNNKNGFLHINSSNLDEEIGYSMLFGYKKGAFTGAEEDKEGLLENKKTIYISSIEHLPYNLFSPLLNLMETGEYYPLGSKEKKVFNGNLIFSSKFQPDELRENIVDSFYFFIKPFILKVPDLKERKDDILPLINFKIKQYNEKTGKSKRISEKLIRFIVNYDFKGNIRELFNYIERGAIESGERDIIEIKDMFVSGEKVSVKEIIGEGIEERITLSELQKRYILGIYKETGGNREKMAKILGITTRSIYNYLKKYGIIDGKN
jgi:DNA-binding NtrC family response regulator